MENLLFDSSLVSPNYLLCYVGQCPRKESCIRFWACQQMADDETTHPCVLPTAVSGGQACKYYKEKRVMCGAWGFKRLFAEVKRKDDVAIRGAIKTYLGGNGTYYRYHHGELLLTEAQQQHIINIFKRCGYTEGLEFDGYRNVYDL